MISISSFAVALGLTSTGSDKHVDIPSTSVLSREDFDICTCVSVNRLNLTRFVEEFHVAVQLFELLERGGGPPSVGVFGGVFTNFRLIAARDGALSLYHFSCSLEALQSLLIRCPTTRNSDLKALKTAAKVFRRAFPNAAALRHAVAHAGEVFANPARMKEHIQQQDFNSPGGFSSAGGYLSAQLFERRFSIGWQGKVFTVTMDISSVVTLAAIQAMAQAAIVIEEAAP